MVPLDSLFYVFFQYNRLAVTLPIQPPSPLMATHIAQNTYCRVVLFIDRPILKPITLRRIEISSLV